MIDQMKKRLLAEPSAAAAITRILDDAIALSGAEFGTFQLPADGELLLVESRGFKLPFLKTFRVVAADHGLACGRTLRTLETVLIEDTEADAEFAPLRPVAKAAGYRSVVTTPLAVGRTLMGVVATHFANVHRPTAIELRILEEYGAFAATYLQELLEGEPPGELARRLNDQLYARHFAASVPLRDAS